MDIVKNLICLENNMVSVIRYKSNKLEFVKKDGEVEFPITVDFWTWWERAVSYIDDESVDICFVYDKDYDLLKNDKIIEKNVLNTENSCWKIEKIQAYFAELRRTYFNIVIVGQNEQEYVLGKDKGPAAHRFYTNLNIQSYVTKKNTKANDSIDQNVQINEEEYSEFAKYFIDMVRRERGYI